jgi:23S rRNA (uracil1939-C5)-methyltransferase
MKLRIDKSVYGGASLARISAGDLAGKTVFVPLTLPGELVEAHITEDKRSFFNAEFDAIVEPSLLRTTPTCPYFGTCGGCSYQHAVYAHQLDMKSAILRESLERAGNPDIPPIHALSGEHWRYRNRIRLHVQARPFALGYLERRSRRLLPIAECPIAASLLERAITLVTQLGASLDLASLADEIEFFTNAAEDSLLISLLAKKLAPNGSAQLNKVCAALKIELPELIGAGLFTSQPKQPGKVAATWGQSFLFYEAANFNYRVGIGSFFQVNRFLVDALVDLVTIDRKGRLAWDLYAGVGLFARALTTSFERVIAVESAPGSFEDLRGNLEGTSHRTIQATTLDFLRKQKPSSTKNHTPPDLVVVDPPRAGLGAESASLLAAIGPAEIVYVSCDPATLSRDLSTLLQSGYDLRTITMVDMFPQTFHLESVSVLQRR